MSGATPLAACADFSCASLRARQPRHLALRTPPECQVLPLALSPFTSRPYLCKVGIINPQEAGLSWAHESRATQETRGGWRAGSRLERWDPEPRQGLRRTAGWRWPSRGSSFSLLPVTVPPAPRDGIRAANTTTPRTWPSQAVLQWRGTCLSLATRLSLTQLHLDPSCWRR